MNVKLENVEKNIVKLEIELSQEIFEEGMKKSFVKNAKNFKVNGFRPGKVPRNIVEKVYGKSVFYDDAVNFIIPDAYDKAVEENSLEPVDRPEFDIVQIGEDKPFIFSAKVTVMPDVELGEYKGLTIQNVSDVVTQNDILNEINKVADKNSRLVSVEDRAVANGDTVIIDFDGSVDGVAFDGGAAVDYTLVIGSGSFIPGFEEQLVGTDFGADVEVNIIFPEDYQSADLAGRAAVFKVKVNEIKFKEVPVIDDEFANDVSEFNSLDEYKADIRSKLEEKAKTDAINKMKDSVIAKATQNALIDLPEVMITKQVQIQIDIISNNFKRQGISLEQYCQYTENTVEKMMEEIKPSAEKVVRERLVIEKISKVEEIKAEDEQVSKEIEVVAKQYNLEIEAFNNMLTNEDKDNFVNKIIFQNTIEFLYNNANKV